MASLHISTPFFFKLHCSSSASSSSPDYKQLLKLWSVKCPYLRKPRYKHKRKSSWPLLANATVCFQTHSFSSPLSAVAAAATTATKLGQRRERVDAEQDPISVLNERIRRDHSKREASRPAMDSEEADKYIQMVKKQQQRGLQKLKGDKDGVFSYKVDPYTLNSGDYVVHKKVGIGRFFKIKFGVPKGPTAEPVEYLFIEYADGMAKLPVKQASRLLYRYNL